MDSAVRPSIQDWACCLPEYDISCWLLPLFLNNGGSVRDCAETAVLDSDYCLFLGQRGGKQEQRVELRRVLEGSQEDFRHKARERNWTCTTEIKSEFVCSHISVTATSLRNLQVPDVLKSTSCY